MVYQVGRHGYRSSKIKFEGLIEDESQNFEKFNELLTNYGLKQTFERGEDIMIRYQSIMKDTDIRHVSVRSSFKARTRLSALSQLLGMFGNIECKTEMIDYTSTNNTFEVETIDDLPHKLREWLSEFLPYVDAEEYPNKIFNVNGASCDLHQNLKKIYSTKEQLILSDLEHKIIDWTNQYYPISRNEVGNFCGIIRSLYAHHIKFKSNFNSIEEIVDLWIKYSYEKRRHITAGNEIISLLYWNEQLKYILNAINTAASQYQLGTNIDPIFYFDSCHDSNIYAIMIHIGNKERVPTKFGSSLFFELHEDDLTHKLYVKIYFDNDQLPIHRKEIYLNIGLEDSQIEKSKSSFNPINSKNVNDSKSSSLEYFNKLIRSIVVLKTSC